MLSDGIRLDYSDIAKAAAKVEGGARVMVENVKRATDESLAFAQNFIAKYPPKSSGKRMVFQSEKQRRWFFWALRTGEIEVPYRRTGTLGKSWTTDVRATSDSIRGVLGNVRPYAPYVQDEELQAQMHKGHWPTVQMLLRAPAARMSQFFNQAMERTKEWLANASR